VEDTKQSLEITIPLEEIETETDAIVEGLKGRVKIPGFRPGKVPSGIIRSRYADEIRHEVLQSLVPKALGKRFQDENLNVVGEPDIKDLKFESGEPLSFRAEFEVLPEIELEDYSDIETTYCPPEVKDEDIDQRIEALREQKADYVNEDPRPVAEGDHAVVSLKSISGVEGEPIERDELMLAVGDVDTIADFSTNLLGMEPGQEKEFDVTYPEDYGEQSLSGKTVRFLCKVSGIRRKELPEVNDEFAKDLGDYQDLAELRDTIRGGLQNEREFLAVREAKNEIIEKLIDMHDFPVPEVLVDRQIESTIQQRLQELAAQGVDPRNLQIDWKKVRESQSERARREVKGSLLLARIAEREAIQVTNQDVDTEIQRIAQQRREMAAVVRKRLEEQKQLNSLANSIRTDKTLNKLFDMARKVAPKEGAPEENKENGD